MIDSPLNRCQIGDCREVLKTVPDETFQCVVTSPPYWGLRSYLADNDPDKPLELGTEQTPDEYVANLVTVFREVRRVLRKDGTVWLNLGDCYRDKQLQGIPWRVAFALQADGWWLRSESIWFKINGLPEPVTDRPAKAHEPIFLMARSPEYFYDADAVRVSYSREYKPGAGFGGFANRSKTKARKRSESNAMNRSGYGPDALINPLVANLGTVWEIATQPLGGAHFAPMPPALVQRCILAGSRVGDAVLDPFMGSGTVGMVAESLGRRWFGCELNPEYGKLISERTAQVGLFGRTG